ncbi:hypothetical protein [Erwinia sp. S59]|uniref:hypothetical protein n=1 Tax=Erwinia sp. S59 TaxID=2769340 RepID=UPI00190B388C|nr:hypothetical protein [Erwinia sp. S59]MBK0089445.1 hypothetical protein [Erwinia sp. S59]
MPKQSELNLRDDDELLRLLFSSIDYHDGDITKVAISLDDLKERGFSLDIARIASQSIVNERALAQVSRAKAPEDREKGYIAKFSNLEINAELDTDAKKLFLTNYSPMHGNHAHASLTCFIGAGEKRSYYLLARARLREHLLKNIVELERYPFSH